MHLSLLSGTKIRVLNGDKTELVLVNELVGKEVYVYDFYGNRHKISVERGTTKFRWMAHAVSGEMVQFGGEHSILIRKHDVAGYKRLPVTELLGPGFVRLPQKKIMAPPGAVQFLDFEEKTGLLFLTPDTVQNMVALVESVASSGVTVFRHSATLRIDLEKQRPVCFASKLLSGSFQADLQFTLNDLAARGIVQPWRLFSDAVVEETEKTGVIFEGNCIYNDMPIAPMRKIDRPTDVFNITLDDPLTPVELPWFVT